MVVQLKEKADHINFKKLNPAFCGIFLWNYLSVESQTTPSPKPSRMKHYRNFLQSAIIILILCLNSYTLANGIRLGSFWGIVLSFGSIAALIYCIRLFKKLKEVESGEDVENY